MQEKLQGYWGQESSLPNAQFLPKAQVSQGSRKQINSVLLQTSDTSESPWTTLPPSCWTWVLSEGPSYCRLWQVCLLPFNSIHIIDGLGLTYKTSGWKEPVFSLTLGGERDSECFLEEVGWGVATILWQLPLSSCKSCHCWAQSRPSKWEEKGEHFGPRLEISWWRWGLARVLRVVRKWTQGEQKK